MEENNVNYNGQGTAPQAPFAQQSAPQAPFAQQSAPQEPFAQQSAPQAPFGQAPAYGMPATEYGAVETKKKSKAWIWIVIAAVAAVAIGIAAYFMLSEEDGPIVEIDGHYFFNMTAADFETKYNDTLKNNFAIDKYVTGDKDSVLEKLPVNSIEKDDEMTEFNDRDSYLHYGSVGEFGSMFGIGFYEDSASGKLVGASATMNISSISSDNTTTALQVFVINCANLCQMLVPDMTKEDVEEITTLFVDKPGETTKYEKYGIEIYAKSSRDSAGFIISANGMPQSKN